MSSSAQIAANRQNATRSTGPKTPAGKAVASRNALRHGLLSRDAVLPDEDEDLFRELHYAICAQLAPVGEIEEVLVERIVMCIWRLRRLIRIEAGVIQWELANQDTAPEPDAARRRLKLGAAFVVAANHNDPLTKLSRHEVSIERSLYRALGELREQQAARQGRDVNAPTVIDVNVSTPAD